MKRNCCKVLAVLFGAVLGSILTGTVTPVFAAYIPDYKAMGEYPLYESVIADASGTNQGQGGYALYDIDEDGVRELIVSAGTCEADWLSDIYMLEDGLVTMMGTFGAHDSFYVAPDGNGIYSVHGKQGWQEIKRLTKTGDKIIEEDIQSGELGENEEYYSNDNPIILRDFTADMTADVFGYNVQVSAPDGGVNMRCGAGVEYSKVLPNMIPNGTILYITQEAMASNGNYWGYTTYNGTAGWIALTQVTTDFYSYSVRVSAPDGGVNMRCGAGVEYSKVLPNMIPNGTILCITQEAMASNGNYWGYTTYNGTSGWVALTQVTSLEPIEGSPIPHTRYVINCNESITLRTSPDVNAPEICQIPLGTAVSAFGDAGNGFLSVYYQGASGYCLAYYLSEPVD